MTVNRKIFVAITSFVISLAAIFILVTHFVIKESFEAMVGKARGEEVEEVSNRFIQYYVHNEDSWEGVQQLVLGQTSLGNTSDISLLLLSKDRKQLYAEGTARDKLVTNLGIKRLLHQNGQTIAYLYYYDPEVANMSKLRIGIPISVTFLLSASAIVFVLISLLVAYWIAKRITAPLRKLITAIDRLGQGELGTQAPVLSNDEYGKLAVAFNTMSAQLLQTETTRRNLVADVAHELRTPLTIVRGKLDMIQHSGSTIEPVSLLPLQDELIRLSRLVDDLHLLSLAEAKKLPLEKKPTNMVDLVRRVMNHVASDAAQKNIHLSLENDAQEHLIQVDQNRMTQVMLNLLVNAIRYTPEGGSVTVAVQERSARQEENTKLMITISDTGVGIEPEQLVNIFNRFYRTDEARTRNSGGMGLGLAIAREFVLAHNGTLEVDSTPGQGTVFIVELKKKDPLS
jgi:two-component system sensor histidine kinase BaeS